MMNKQFTDEFDPISFDDFEKALKAVPEGHHIKFSDLMRQLQINDCGKPMYLDIQSYTHNVKWPSIPLEKISTDEGHVVSNVDDLLLCLIRWMLCIYECSHKTRNCIIPPTFRFEHLT